MGIFLCEITGAGRRKSLKREPFSFLRPPIPHLPRQFGWWARLRREFVPAEEESLLFEENARTCERSGVWIRGEIRSSRRSIRPNALGEEGPYVQLWGWGGRTVGCPSPEKSSSPIKN